MLAIISRIEDPEPVVAQKQPQQNAHEPGWPDVRAKIFLALRNYPEARDAIDAAVDQLRQGS